MAELTLFYDGNCPLCVNEINHLKRLDQGRRIEFENIHAEDFTSRYPDVDREEASAILLGDVHGQRLRGLDVTHRAWSLVGRGWLTAPLRWPLIRPIADRVYLWFAPDAIAFQAGSPAGSAVKAVNRDSAAWAIKSPDPEPATPVATTAPCERDRRALFCGMKRGLVFGRETIDRMTFKRLAGLEDG